jgi:transglutaminase-like putative cysteine protease
MESTVRLKAGCEMLLEAPEPAPVVAMLRPRSGPAQWLARESYELAPLVPASEYVDGFGNLCQRFVAPKGQMKVRTEVELAVSRSIDVQPGAPLTEVNALPDGVLQFLLPSRFVPSDELGELAREAVRGQTPGYDQVEAIRSWIEKNIEYRYGVSKPTTTAKDTIKTGAGVCRDFSHIGMAFCRALRIPARMVVGYLHRLDPMDMHAWFEAFVGGRWFTFDATQKQPRGGRITIAYGRDAADVALITELATLKTKDMKVWVDEL